MRAKIGVLDLIRTHADQEEDVSTDPVEESVEIRAGEAVRAPEDIEVEVQDEPSLEDEISMSNLEESSQGRSQGERKSVLRDSSRRRTTDTRFRGMTDEERERVEQQKTVKALRAIRELEDEISSNRGLRKGSGTVASPLDPLYDDILVGLWVRVFNMKRNFLLARDFSGFMEPYSLVGKTMTRCD